ncbi:MAG TPA: protein kinase [Ktedonobacteraceae bacterium]|nr:protein kinase [Ktedonobacteraceae bacterium]
MRPDSARPAFEKPALRKVSPAQEISPEQSASQALPGTDSLAFNARVTPPPVSQPGWSGVQQEIRQPTSQPLSSPQTPRPGMFSTGTTTRGNSQPLNASASQSTARPTSSPLSSNSGQTATTRPLLPGVMLRGGRYRLQELQERQDWLGGVFEAVWVGRDAHRNASQVMITEVVLPDNTSVMTQSILRTATMSLASVGRHPRIPALWDAFSDQGRSFFVFEPIEGESLLTRMRLTGRPLSEQEVIECCLQMTDVLELLAQQAPQMVHGLIRPEHIIIGRNGHYYLTNFSIVLAGGATQFITGMERSRLSPYTAPEFVRGVADVRTDMYSLLATAYHSVTGSVPSGISGSVPQAQRINSNISSEFDAILTKGLRAVANQRYQRPSELRQDLLALRSVSGSLVPGVEASSPYAVETGRTSSAVNAPNEDNLLQALPIRMATSDADEERVMLLPRPEELPPLKQGNDTFSAMLLLGTVLACLIVIVILSQVLA